jgi:hypothetical protein
VKFKKKNRKDRPKKKRPSALGQGLPPGPRIISKGSLYLDNGGAGISTHNPNMVISSEGDVFRGNKKGGIVDESK